MIRLIRTLIGNGCFIPLILNAAKGFVLEKFYLFRRLLKYWSESRCCGFWRWPRREAVRAGLGYRYPQRSVPSEQPRKLSGPKSTQPAAARGRKRQLAPNAFGAGGVARSVQPAAGMRLPRSLLLPLRATHPSISTVS